MATLTETLSIDKANTTRAVRDLEAKNYLLKIPQGGRGYTLKLSPTGKKLAQGLKTSLSNHIKKVLKDFTPKEVETWHKLTNKFMLGVENVRN